MTQASPAPDAAAIGTPSAHRPGALAGVRVLDLSRILAGPWSTQNLADMGADVIKVERPGEGDDTRAWGPPFLTDPETGRIDSSYFISVNRGKRSITIDMASAEGQAMVRELAAQSDILVENYKVGTLARYGLGYEDLRQVNPKLVYCSITGFGQTGPYAELPGYDFVFQGLGGLMSITGEPDDVPGGGPMKVGIAVADVLSGMYATVAILGGLTHARATGVGQQLDIALLDCVIALTSYQALNWMMSGNTPQRIGNAHSNIVPYQVFACREGHIIIAVANDGQYQRYCQAIGLPELATDPRYRTVGDRNRNRDALIPVIAERMRTRSRDEWIEILNAVNVPTGPIKTIPEAFDDPQVVHRQMRVQAQRANGQVLPLLASPLRMSETPVAYDRAPPRLGEHTDEVLRTVLGYSAEKIAALRAAKAI